MQIVRELYHKVKPYISTPEAIVITGMRRVGKTTLLRHIMQEIESENKIFIDLENPVNRKHFEEDNYEKILDSLRFLGLKTGEMGFVFLDEIQFVSQIPSVVKYLADHYRIKFFLSGSSSFYLKNLFSESLSGRKYLFELHPLSFREYLSAKNPALRLESIQGRVTRGVFEELDRYYSDYIMFGGFPGVVLKESVEEKRMMLQDIFSSYFQLEVIQLGDFRKTNVIRDLMLLLMERVGSRLDFQKLSKELGVSRETIYNYMAFLENPYFISLIRPFSSSRDSEVRSTPKFYLCDTRFPGRFPGRLRGRLPESVRGHCLRMLSILRLGIRER